MNKPYAYIMIPNLYVGNRDDSEYISQLISELRSFNYDPSEVIVTDDNIRGETTFVTPDTRIGTRTSTIHHFELTLENMEEWWDAKKASELSKEELLRRNYYGL
jgi:hypothetical protein